MMIEEILGHIVRRNPLRSQREVCAIAARRSIAALGPAKTDHGVRDVCIGLASGLFGEVYFAAERDRLIAMMEEEYRKARG